MKKKSMAVIMTVVGCCLMMAGAVWGQVSVPSIINNGTVNVNGLVWLKDAGCLGRMNWDQAMARCKSLKSGECGLTDGSKAGKWRLPTKDELKNIYSSNSKFRNVQLDGYWSSTTFDYDPSYAWYVYFNYGGVDVNLKSSSFYVRCVRGGQ